MKPSQEFSEVGTVTILFSKSGTSGMSEVDFARSPDVGMKEAGLEPRLYPHHKISSSGSTSTCLPDHTLYPHVVCNSIRKGLGFSNPHFADEETEFQSCSNKPQGHSRLAGAELEFQHKYCGLKAMLLYVIGSLLPGVLPESPTLLKGAQLVLEPTWDSFADPSQLQQKGRVSGDACWRQVTASLFL